MNRKIRILGVAPYESMKDTMLRVANERDDIEVTAVVGDLEAGANVVRQYESEDFDAILSRGGTLLEIKKVTAKPVFEIPITYFDLLNVMKLVENYTGKIAIITYPNIAKSVKVLCDILHDDYQIFIIHSWKDAKETVQNAQEQGYTLIIGDTVAVHYTKLFGIQGILLTSGQESVNLAYNDVVRVCTYYARIKSEHDLLEALFRNWNKRIIVWNEKEECVYQTNPDESKAFFTSCRRMIPELKKEERLTVHKKVQNSLFMITAANCRIYSSTYYLFLIEQSQLDFQTIPGLDSVEVYNYDSYLDEDKSDMPFCGSEDPQMKKQCARLAQSDASILIIANSGTGKERCAQHLYRNSNRAHFPLYVVNCSLLSRKDLEYLLFEERSPLYSLKGTIFFKDAQLLDDILFDKLTEGLQHVNRMRKSRLIFSYESNSSRSTIERDNCRYEILRDQIGCTEICLPPLRECANDIPNLSVLYISQQNRISGSQCVGLEPEAIDILENYSWPHNIKQLEQILREAMLTDSPWITAKTIRQLLGKSKELTAVCSSSEQINLKQPLSGIVFDVAMRVLTEENMNQSRAAKRLGIGRTTLWRLLKSGK